MPRPGRWVYARLPVKPPTSVAVTVREKVAAKVAVPLRTPLLDKVKPVGSVRAVTAKVYGPPAPPLGNRERIQKAKAMLGHDLNW